MTSPHPPSPESKPMPVSPTPWKNNGGRIDAADGTVVATVGIVNEQTHQDTANARVIVATHDMLAALEALFGAPDEPSPLGLKVGRSGEYAQYVFKHIEIDQARNAIAQARGEPARA